MIIIITKSLFLKNYSLILANNYLRAREIEDERVEQRAVDSGRPVKNGVLAHTNHNNRLLSGQNGLDLNALLVVGRRSR